MESSTNNNKLKVFLICTTFIYVLFCLSSILQEELITLEYQNIQTKKLQKLPNQGILILFPNLVSWVISYLYNEKMKLKKKIFQYKNSAMCGILKFVSLISYTWAVTMTNFPIVMVFKSCSILSVVLVAVLCTRVSDKKLKLGQKKLILGLIISVGIFWFTYYDPEQKQKPKQSVLLGIFLLFVSILADGFLPDFQAYIKSQFNPQPTQMMQQINKWSTIVCFVFMVCSFTLYSSILFLAVHPKFALHLILMSLYACIGQFFVYKMIKQFKQHIVPFVITTRKILTILLSIFFLNHQTNLMQLFGVFIVFCAVLYQFYQQLTQQKQPVVLNYRSDFSQQIQQLFDQITQPQELIPK